MTEQFVRAVEIIFKGRRRPARDGGRASRKKELSSRWREEDLIVEAYFRELSGNDIETALHSIEFAEHDGRWESVVLLSAYFSWMDRNGLDATSDGRRLDALRSAFGLALARRLSGFEPEHDDSPCIVPYRTTPDQALGRTRPARKLAENEEARLYYIKALLERATRSGYDDGQALASVARHLGLTPDYIDELLSDDMGRRAPNLVRTASDDELKAMIDEIGPKIRWERRSGN